MTKKKEECTSPQSFDEQSPTKADWQERMANARERMKQRCIQIALKYTPESVTEMAIRKSLRGNVEWNGTRMEVPRPFTRKSLYIFLHECAHVHLEHCAVKTATKRKHPRTYQKEIRQYETAMSKWHQYNDLLNRKAAGEAIPQEIIDFLKREEPVRPKRDALVTRCIPGSRKPRHVEEYEAEKWAHEVMRAEGIPVPRSMTKRARQYVARKIRQAERRGAKRIDSAARRFSEGGRRGR